MYPDFRHVKKVHPRNGDIQDDLGSLFGINKPVYIKHLG